MMNDNFKTMKSKLTDADDLDIIDLANEQESHSEEKLTILEDSKQRRRRHRLERLEEKASAEINQHSSCRQKDKSIRAERRPEGGKHEEDKEGEKDNKEVFHLFQLNRQETREQVEIKLDPANGICYKKFSSNQNAHEKFQVLAWKDIVQIKRSKQIENDDRATEFKIYVDYVTFDNSKTSNTQSQTTLSSFTLSCWKLFARDEKTSRRITARASQLLKLSHQRPRNLLIFTDDYASNHYTDNKKSNCCPEVEDVLYNHLIPTLNRFRISHKHANLSKINTASVYNLTCSFDAIALIGGDTFISSLLSQILVNMQSTANLMLPKSDTSSETFQFQSFDKPVLILPASSSGVRGMPCEVFESFCSIQGAEALHHIMLCFLLGRTLELDMMAIYKNSQLYRFGFSAHFGFYHNVFSRVAESALPNLKCRQDDLESSSGVTREHKKSKTKSRQKPSRTHDVIQLAIDQIVAQLKRSQQYYACHLEFEGPQKSLPTQTFPSFCSDNCRSCHRSHDTFFNNHTQLNQHCETTDIIEMMPQQQSYSDVEVDSDIDMTTAGPSAATATNTAVRIMPTESEDSQNTEISRRLERMHRRRSSVITNQKQQKKICVQKNYFSWIAVVALPCRNSAFAPFGLAPYAHLNDGNLTLMTVCQSVPPTCNGTAGNIADSDCMLPSFATSTQSIGIDTHPHQHEDSVLSNSQKSSSWKKLVQLLRYQGLNKNLAKLEPNVQFHITKKLVARSTPANSNNSGNSRAASMNYEDVRMAALQSGDSKAQLKPPSIRRQRGSISAGQLRARPALEILELVDSTEDRVDRDSTSSSSNEELPVENSDSAVKQEISPVKQHTRKSRRSSAAALTILGSKFKSSMKKSISSLDVRFANSEKQSISQERAENNVRSRLNSGEVKDRSKFSAKIHNKKMEWMIDYNIFDKKSSQTEETTNDDSWHFLACQGMISVFGTGIPDDYKPQTRRKLYLPLF